jgi:hypothetical protein
MYSKLAQLKKTIKSCIGPQSVLPECNTEIETNVKHKSKSSEFTKSSSSHTRSICDKTEILGISHYTSLKNLLLILQSGSINSKVELLRKKIDVQQVSAIQDSSNILTYEYPGVFLSLIMKNDIGKSYGIYGINETIYLIFSKVLLKQNNYHLRTDDENGIIDELAYSKQAIDKFLENVTYNEYLPSLNELVFHDPISLNALQQIIVPYKPTYDMIMEELNKPIENINPKYKDLVKYKDIIILEDEIQDKYYNEYCNLTLKELNKRKIINSKLKPNYCYYIPAGSSKEIIQKFADNCGVDISKATFKTVRVVNYMLKDAIEKNYTAKPKDRVIPKWIPGINLY